MSRKRISIVSPMNQQYRRFHATCRCGHIDIINLEMPALFRHFESVSNGTFGKKEGRSLVGYRPQV